jgi:protein-S-isoprenylcysteine O-methyltransferase Ste14
MKLNYATLLVILAAAIYFAAHASHLPWTPARILGLAIAIPSFLLLVLARIQLGGAFSVQARASTLVSTGLYARIRNPIYVFSALMIVGIIIWASRPWWFLCLAILIPVQIVRSRKESRVLEEKFGEAYLGYKKKTWF